MTSNKKYYTKNEILDIKNSISIFDVINKYNIEIDKSYNDKKSIKLKSRNGFFIFKDGKGFWQATSGNKGNVIDFCKAIFNDNYIDALNRLNSLREGQSLTSNHEGQSLTSNHEGQSLTSNHEGQSLTSDHEGQSLTSNHEGQSLTFDPYTIDENPKKVIAYLTKTRKIDENIVLEEIKNKRLFQLSDSRGFSYCAFVGYNNTIPAYCLIRSTLSNSSFRKDLPGSNKSYGYKILPSVSAPKKEVFVFESPIDLLSFKSLYKDLMNLDNAYFVSLSGISTKALDTLLNSLSDTENRDIKIAFCLDNDQTGITASEQLTNFYKNKGYSTYAFIPNSGKDFNEILVNSESVKQCKEPDSVADL